MSEKCKIIIDDKLIMTQRGIYGFFIISKNTEDKESCVYIGKSEQLFERAKQHKKSILSKTNINSFKRVDADEILIEIRLIEPVKYKYDNYYKDAQRLASRENYCIDAYQEMNQCLEQVPEGKRPTIEVWEQLKKQHK